MLRALNLRGVHLALSFVWGVFYIFLNGFVCLFRLTNLRNVSVKAVEIIKFFQGFFNFCSFRFHHCGLKGFEYLFYPDRSCENVSAI